MDLQRQLKEAESALAAKADGSRLLKEEVTEDDIAEIISKWTGESSLASSCLSSSLLSAFLFFV
jgi:ATP-dependent Clp protease ATP-binding subunit ClpA